MTSRNIRSPKALAARFWSKVKKAPGDACWTWLGARSSASGYATFNYLGHNINGHRAAWLLTNGAIKGKDIDVLHTCNNGHLGCVRPSHLYLGTHRDNMLDKMMAGRDALAKLTADQVREIRVLLGTMPQKDIAMRYGVKHGVISKLSCGDTYGWVE